MLKQGVVKIYLPILIISSLVLISVSNTLAQDATNSVTPREKLLQQRNTKNIAVLNNLENKVQSIKENFASREAQLKAKLDTFRDQKKAEIALRVSNNLNKINSKRTEQMTKHLQVMTNILGKLENKAGGASASAEIAKAKDAIASAQTAVTAQSEKDYTVTVTTENKIRVDTKTKRNLLMQDLQATRTIVIEAKQSLANAISIVRSMIGGNF